MITLPLFHSEFHAVPKVPERLMSPENWIASSEALPEDGVQVLCFLPSKQTRRHEPQIYHLHLRDGQWIPDSSNWMDELWFPVEAVTYWCSIECVPEKDDPRWNTDLIMRTVEEFRGDIWIWNDKKQVVYQYWCEARDGQHIENSLYYGSSGDPVLHDEFVTKWMPCIQPENISMHFEEQFHPRVWQEPRQLPKWLQHVHDAGVGQKGMNHLWWRTKQLNLDLK